MVLNKTIESKEDRAEIPKRKGMENTANNKPEETPNLSSKMSDTSSETDLPPQAVITWIIMSISFGLFSIYTMVHWISNKLTNETENGKTIGDQNNQPTTDIREISAPAQDSKQESTDCDCNTNLHASDKVSRLSSSCQNFEQCQRSKDSVKQVCETGKIVEERQDAEKQLDNGGRSSQDGENVVCGKCSSNRPGVVAVQMGPGFTGNLNIISGTSAEFSATTTSESTSNLETGADDLLIESSLRSTATLQNYNPNQTAPVTVNNLYTKCLTCNANMPRTEDSGLSSSISDCSKPHSTADCPQLPTNTICTKLQARSPIYTADNKTDSPELLPPSTINCVKTIVKSLSCDAPKADCLTKNTEFTSQHGTKANESGIPNNETTCDKMNSALLESNKSSPFQDISTGNPDLLQSTNGKKNESEKITKEPSPSLSFLANYHKPRDTTDGSIISKNSSEDEFIFPQDNDTATENQTVDCLVEKRELEAHRTRFLKNIRADPEISKSFDSQIESLKKGCRLLERSPSKSALRSSGSEGCLEKKFVHFPEDIRNIRVVYKYHSFDDTWLDAENTTKNEDQQSSATN